MRSSFKWWNCDLAATAGDVVVTVGGTASGTETVVGAAATDIGWRPASVSQTVAIGASTDTVCRRPAAGETFAIDLSAPDADGTFVVGSEPAESGDAVTVRGIVGRAVRPVELSSLGIESDVTFAADCGLPPGVVLEQVGATRARIAGAPCDLVS